MPSTSEVLTRGFSKLPRVLVRLRLLLAAVALLVGLVGCGSSASTASGGPSENPHPLDHSPATGDVLVTNPDSPLDRAYWVIWRSADGTHYMVPRPETDPRMADACAGTDAFTALVTEARLCAGSSDPAVIARINALTRAEALAVSTWLHERLRFSVTPGTTSIEPYPLISDQVAVCNNNPTDRNGGLQVLCDRELAWADGGSRPGIASSLTAEEAQLLAEGLNQLYGVTALG